MHEEDNQIHVPPSFLAVYADSRQRLREPASVVRNRYELCEDLAGHLVEQAQTLYHVQAPSEAEILRHRVAVDAEHGAGQGPAAERAAVHAFGGGEQAFAVATERFAVGERPVADGEIGRAHV